MFDFSPVILDVPSPEQMLLRNFEEYVLPVIVIAVVVVVAVLLIRRALKKRK
ncbi:MAG: hypothetical protein FWG03_04935 [Clostridiales bacterium]|nr:hypothetical protein [Clostridiales bacterium]